MANRVKKDKKKWPKKGKIVTVSCMIGENGTGKTWRTFTLSLTGEIYLAKVERVLKRRLTEKEIRGVVSEIGFTAK